MYDDGPFNGLVGDETSAEALSRKSQSTGSVVDETCDHDFDNPKRIGRAHYECRKCGKDISLTLMMIEEANLRHPND